MAKLYFYYGAMGSSKSANALMAEYNYRERGQLVLLAKTNIDTRDGKNTIKSRIGLQRDCLLLSDVCTMKDESIQKFDAVIVDPPRKGCDEMLLKTILKMQPKRVVYVSCDSATLARDLRFLCDNGYELKKVCGVDQFPQTVHVETVVLMSRKDK